MDPNGKVALITGAGSGIGRATADALSTAGASIVVSDIDESGGKDTVSQIESSGGSASFIKTDVTKREDLERMVTFAEETYGGLDIVHLNAGIGTPRPTFPDSKTEDWERTMAVDLWAVIAGVQIAVPALRRRGGGVIVSTASMAGIITYLPDPIYAAAKHGVVGLTRALATLKVQENIRVNCVCPGVVDTPLVRRGLDQMEGDERAQQAALLDSMPMMRPEEIAEAVMEFVTDDSLAGEAMGIMYGRPRKLIPPAVRFQRDPAQDRTR